MKIKQLKHSEIVNEKRAFPVDVICDNITSAENVGMVFRISEAFDIEHLFLCGETVVPPNIRLLRAARSTEKYVSYSTHANSAQVVNELKHKKYAIVALEITNSSSELRKCNFKDFTKIALIIGSEKDGVSEELLRLCDRSVAIKMFGKNTSINVVNALSIALYEIDCQLAKLSD